MTTDHPPSSTLVDCAPLGTHRIRRNDASRLLVIDDHALKFSPTQYRIVMLLLQGGVIAETNLVRAAYGDELYVQNNENMRKLIRKIRGRLEAMGLTIARVGKSGYVVVPMPE